MLEVPNSINICLIYRPFIFIPVSGCVGRGPSALLCPGPYYAVKTALIVRDGIVNLPYIYQYKVNN